MCRAPLILALFLFSSITVSAQSVDEIVNHYLKGKALTTGAKELPGLNSALEKGSLGRIEVLSREQLEKEQ